MIKLEGNKAALYQWDLNQRIVIKDVKYDVGYEVHFSHVNDEEGLAVLTYIENGLMYCNVPNILLQRKGIVYAYLYVVEANKTHTKHDIEILVIPREKPLDYVYTETEVLSYKTLEQRMDFLEDKVGGKFETVKTVNGLKPDEQGNVVIDTECKALTNLEIEELLKNFN